MPNYHILEQIIALLKQQPFSFFLNNTQLIEQGSCRLFYTINNKQYAVNLDLLSNEAEEIKAAVSLKVKLWQSSPTIFLQITPAGSREFVL